MHSFLPSIYLVCRLLKGRQNLNSLLNRIPRKLQATNLHKLDECVVLLLLVRKIIMWIYSNRFCKIQIVKNILQACFTSKSLVYYLIVLIFNINQILQTNYSISYFLLCVLIYFLLK